MEGLVLYRKKFIEIQGWLLLIFFICLHHQVSLFYLILKNGFSDFQNSPPFERLSRLYVTISECFKRFQYFNFKTNFLENENLFQKTEVPLFR